MVTKRQKIEMVILVIVTTIVSLLVLLKRDNSNTRTFAATLPSQLASPEPTLVVPGSIEIVSSDSSDGEKNLIMNKVNTGQYIIRSVFTSDASDDSKKLLLTKTHLTSQTVDVTLPYNAWSPDNKYVFLKETTGNQVRYNVYSILEKPFTNNTTSVTINDLFSAKYPSYTITDVTGWAAPNLLLVNTATEDGKIGPSFWFDITDLSFIQLATHFG